MSETFYVSDRAIVGRAITQAGGIQLTQGDVQKGHGKIPSALMFMAPAPFQTTITLAVSLIDGRPFDEVVARLEARIDEVVYNAAIAADKAWSDLLQQTFGAQAGDARYDERGTSTRDLADLYRQFKDTSEALRVRQDRHRRAKCVATNQ